MEKWDRNGAARRRPARRSRPPPPGRRRWPGRGRRSGVPRWFVSAATSVRRVGRAVERSVCGVPAWRAALPSVAPVGVQRTAPSRRVTGERAGRIALQVTSQAMDVDIAFTGVPVSELATGRDFFERLLGRPADVLVNADEVMWRLADPAWLYVVVDPGRAGHALVALSVGDLDATLAELAGRGIRPMRSRRSGTQAARRRCSTPTATRSPSSRWPVSRRLPRSSSPTRRCGSGCRS